MTWWLVSRMRPQNQLTSRLQESDSRQEVEEEESRRRSSLPDRSQSSSRRRQQTGGDSVVGATLRQLQQLGVDVDEEDLTESDRRIHQTVESSRYRPQLITPGGFTWGFKPSNWSCLSFCSQSWSSISVILHNELKGVMDHPVSSVPLHFVFFTSPALAKCFSSEDFTVNPNETRVLNPMSVLII